MYSLTATICTVFISAAFATPAGVGGGLIFVPVFQLLLGLTPKQAAALSQALIAGASLSSFLFTLYEQHRTKTSLFRRDLVYLFLPGVIAGSSLGVLVARIIPGFLQVVLLVLVCLFASFSIFRRAFATFRKESAVLALPSASGTSTAPVQIPDLADFRFPLFVISVFLVNLFFVFLRGSASTQSVANVAYCSPTYWTLFAVQVAVFGSLSLAVGLRTRQVALVAVVLGVGTVAAISGIGGGLVLNPLMLGRGVTPKETSATSILVVLVMSLTAAVDFTVNGVIDPLWHLSLAGVAFLGSVVGMTGLSAVIRKTGRQSVIVFILGCIVVLGGVLALALGVVNLVKDDLPFLFKSPCQ